MTWKGDIQKGIGPIDEDLPILRKRRLDGLADSASQQPYTKVASKGSQHRHGFSEAMFSSRKGLTGKAGHPALIKRTPAKQDRK
jgi:hypothetical protein